jgi:hypothetical protein
MKTINLKLMPKLVEIRFEMTAEEGYDVVSDFIVTEQNMEHFSGVFNSLIDIQDEAELTTTIKRDLLLLDPSIILYDEVDTLSKVIEEISKELVLAREKYVSPIF